MIQPKKVALLTGHGLSKFGLQDTLKQIAPDAEILSIKANHLLPARLSNYDMLVLPGVCSEDSPYPELLSERKATFIKQAVEENGMVVLAFCAAAYYLCNKIVYTKRDNTRKTMNGLGWVDATAKHAFAHITRHTTEINQQNDYILAELNLSGIHLPVRSLNINGPTLLLSDTESGLSDIFIRYTTIEGAAGIVKSCGTGKLILLGIHPEFPLSHPVLPESFSAYVDDNKSLIKVIADKIGLNPKQRELTCA